MRIWTYKNADEKAHTFSRRSKNVKKRTKTYEKRILCKFTLMQQELKVIFTVNCGLQSALLSKSFELLQELECMIRKSAILFVICPLFWKHSKANYKF